MVNKEINRLIVVSSPNFTMLLYGHEVVIQN